MISCAFTTLFILVSAFLVTDTLKPSDTRCSFHSDHKNNTWPKNECDSFVEVYDNLQGTSYTIEVAFPNIDIDENLEISLVKLESECDCSCRCNCSRTTEINTYYVYKGDAKEIRQHITNEMYEACYQFYTDPSIYNFSSCCIYVPAPVSDIKSMPTSTIRNKEKDEENDQTNTIIFGAAGSALAILVLILVASFYIKRQPSPSPEERPIPVTQPIEVRKSKEMLLIYKNQSHNRLEEFLKKLVKGIEKAFPGCIVKDHMNETLLEEGVSSLYRNFLSRFDKVLVLLSPDVSNTLHANQDTFSMFSDLFFDKYLPANRNDQKLIYICHEQLPCLNFNCGVSTIYALPTRLRDLLEKELDFKGDESVIENIISDLRTAQPYYEESFTESISEHIMFDDLVEQL